MSEIGLNDIAIRKIARREVKVTRSMLTIFCYIFDLFWTVYRLRVHIIWNIFYL